MGTTDVEGAELWSRELTLSLGAVDAAGLHLVRLAQELDGDRDAVDDARPAEAGFLLFEVTVLQVLLERLVCLRCFVAESETDDQVDIRCPNMRRHPLRELPHQV